MYTLRETPEACFVPISAHIGGHGDIGVDAIMEQIKVPVRMSEDLRERLKVEAKRSVRSLNGEIIHRLLQSLKQTGRLDEPGPRA